MMLQLVGPVLAQDAKPVSPELESFLSQGLSQGHGAVYVSMGTLARMNSDELHSLARALTALPNPVLWKLNPLHLPGTNARLMQCCCFAFVGPLQAVTLRQHLHVSHAELTLLSGQALFWHL